ncbi:fatty acid/phospholipid synthesis protein PlsX [Mycoplasma putrefaciens]|uniref:Phosphate acyltransferase n=1 Tax=Mycoplasma putrefaciens (strain ATCC 15718 / NCTC 10155 / C30 KS-1 / KS-1) TaxID=743965 RepID=A0A7U3ZSD0_MYCPK|nr:phosphate acyltransferase PlsX [Mycoplasma putrefaciens]AEM68613.1 fatty acid/phospholipid synthesis protein PlsX [Mycoplasma putrefaciens KS1]SYV95479.1 fatty acid/phospholipid synthesis protein PlsX [Mycoplasma putrefaciens]
MFKIAFDVMGSDLGCQTAIQAASEFIKDHNDLFLFLVGDQVQIKDALKTFDITENKYQIIHTTQVIDMNGSILDIRRKKDASIIKTLELVRDQQVDGMLTGGNSAVFIAASHFILGELENIKRPAFMPTMPNIKDKLTLLLDVGANSENDVDDLVGYAVMANVYAQQILKIKKPTIGLLNIGTEKSKGNELQRQTFNLLTQKKELNFVGNVEARDILTGQVDVIITDGYSGNIALKACEGTAKVLLTEIKKQITSSLFKKICALMLKPAFKKVALKFDYKNHAGAIVLGSNGICFKSHGSSDVQSFKATLRMTLQAVRNDVLNKIKKGLKDDANH